METRGFLGKPEVFHFMRFQGFATFSHAPQSCCSKWFSSPTVLHVTPWILGMILRVDDVALKLWDIDHRELKVVKSSECLYSSHPGRTKYLDLTNSRYALKRYRSIILRSTGVCGVTRRAKRLGLPMKSSLCWHENPKGLTAHVLRWCAFHKVIQKWCKLWIFGW